jgi:hypothetical protein
LVTALWISSTFSWVISDLLARVKGVTVVTWKADIKVWQHTTYSGH